MYEGPVRPLTCFSSATGKATIRQETKGLRGADKTHFPQKGQSDEEGDCGASGDADARV